MASVVQRASRRPRRQRESRLDLLVSLAATAAGFTPIWGILLATTAPFDRFVSLKRYARIAFPPAAAVLVLAGTYGASRNEHLLRRLVTGFFAGLAANVVLDGGRLAMVGAGKMADFCPMVGHMVLGEDPHTENPRTRWPAYVIAYLYHYVGNSALWGSIYALWFGRARWWWGVLYGTWVGVMMLSTAPVTRLLGTRNFGFNKGPMMPPMIMMFHWLWGGTLGLLVERYLRTEPGPEGL